LTEKARIVYAKEAELVYGDSTTKRLFTLPIGARPIRVTVVTEADATSAACDIGTLSDDDKYVAALDVSSAGVAPATLLDSDKLTTLEDIYGLIASASSGGPFKVIFEFTSEKVTGPK